MKIALIILLTSFIGCQQWNSNTFDEQIYGDGGVELTGGENFKASYAILKNRCMSCHLHSEWAGFTDKQDWVTNGLVVPGDPDASDLINRIRNYGGSNSNMPPDTGPLPPNEYSKLVEWVTAINS